MEGGSTAGYFAIRMKSDIVYEREYEGARTREKYCSRPGRYCGLVFLTDVETGEPLAIINDGTLQHLRVAADSAIGTDLMARGDCTTLGMLGSGGMARSHVEALLEVRRIEHLKVFSPTRANRERFAAEIAERHDIECGAFDSPREVYRGADILAACTDSAVPVIRGAWLEAGMHVVSIGGRPDDAPLCRSAPGPDHVFGEGQYPGCPVLRGGCRGLRGGAARGAGARPANGLVLAGHTRLRKRHMKNSIKPIAVLAACGLIACSAAAQTLFDYGGADR